MLHLTFSITVYTYLLIFWNFVVIYKYIKSNVFINFKCILSLITHYSIYVLMHFFIRAFFLFALIPH